MTKDIRKMHQIIIVICILIICLLFSEKGHSTSDEYDRIDSFISSYRLQKLEERDAQENMDEKSLERVTGDTERRAIYINAFDVSEDGRIAIAMATGTGWHTGMISIYDDTMKKEQSYLTPEIL